MARVAAERPELRLTTWVVAAVAVGALNRVAYAEDWYPAGALSELAYHFLAPTVVTFGMCRAARRVRRAGARPSSRSGLEWFVPLFLFGFFAADQYAWSGRCHGIVLSQQAVMDFWRRQAATAAVVGALVASCCVACFVAAERRAPPARTLVAASLALIGPAGLWMLLFAIVSKRSSWIASAAPAMMWVSRAALALVAVGLVLHLAGLLRGRRGPGVSG